MFLLKNANKKTITIFAVATSITFVILVLAILAAHHKVGRLSASNCSGTAISKGKRIYPVPTPQGEANQFILPNDAEKSGEIAVIVDDLDGAKNSVAQVADKNSGDVYSSFISYASNNIKNGSVVVQVPVENFDAAFSQLKTVGKQLIQESTRQIPQNNIYPQPMAAESGVSAKAAPASIVMPINFQQPVQDKGYIKVVFADYPVSINASNASNVSNANISGGNRLNLANLIGFGYTGQNMRNNIWLVLGIKSILLIVLIVILVIVAKKIKRDLKRIRKNKQDSHVVRQMTKTRARVVRIKKK